ncbi:MAG: cation:proton antiporter, partial [Planctomycetaceae bacterium]
MQSPLLYLTSVVVLGAAAQWLAWRFRLPAILLLLAVGFVAGLTTDLETMLDGRLLFPAVSLSVAIILFGGGLSLKFRDLADTKQVVIRLITIGAAVTWVLATAAGRLVFETNNVAALVGAVFVVTGPTVIIPLLRQVQPVPRIGAIAKWEGIVIDPIGALLAVLVYEVTLAAGPGTAL